MTRTLTAAALAAVALALSAAHVAKWRSPVRFGAPAAVVTENAEQSPASLRLRLEGQPLDAFQETVSRPLFWSSRRPQSPAETTPLVRTAAPVAPSVTPAELRLAGIMVEGVWRRRALLVSPALAGGRWVEEGMEIEGWRLTRIEGAAVRIETGGRQQVLVLE